MSVTVIIHRDSIEDAADLADDVSRDRHAFAASKIKFGYDGPTPSVMVDVYGDGTHNETFLRGYVLGWDRGKRS